MSANMESGGTSFLLRHFRSRKVYFVFAAFFIVFGIAVALLTSTLNYLVQHRNITATLQYGFENTVQNKITVLRITRESLDAALHSLVTSEFTHNYLGDPNPENTRRLAALFRAVVGSEPDYYQLRFIDAAGQEKMRVNRVDAKNITLVPAERLQDKSSRYYVKETLSLPDGSYWYSRLDLNVEDGEIVRPVQPTIRATTPVYHEGKLRGLLIINVDVSAALRQFSASADLTLFIQDKDQAILHHPDPTLAWSRYLNENTERAEQYIRSLESDYFTKPLSSVIKNQEELHLAVIPKSSLIDSLTRDNMSTAVFTAVIVLIISFPLSWLVALFPARQQLVLSRTLDDLDRSNTLLDKHVMISETDPEGTITRVSHKMREVSGFEEHELIGKEHSVMRHPDTPRDLHRDLWKTISAGKAWKGEIKDRKKSGSPFWIQSIITPIVDEDGAPLGYTQIAQDITDRKALEHLSQTDPLTQCYNRRKLGEILYSELKRYERYREPLSVVMLDLDEFKSINDKWGHQAGDDTLIAAANLLKKLTREVDAVGRWGGEEFLVVCPHTALEGAALLAEKLRQAMAALELDYDFEVTSSFGVASIRPDEAINRLLARADEALYRAKEEGRNRVIIQD